MIRVPYKRRQSKMAPSEYTRGWNDCVDAMLKLNAKEIDNGAKVTKRTPPKFDKRI